MGSGGAALAQADRMTAMQLGLREWGFAEHWAGWSALVGIHSQARDEAAVGRWFDEAFGSTALVLNSGSSALHMALALLSEQQPRRNEVVLPALACPALTRVVLACGLLPRYVDIAPNLNTPVESIRAGMGPRSLAVIMVHAYGHRADSAGIFDLCQAHGVALIDDAAQRIEPGSGLGTAGDFGIFSFAQSKSVVCGIDGSGGVLLVHAQAHQATLKQAWLTLPLARQRRLAWLEFLLATRAARAAYYVSRLRRFGGQAPKTPARIGGIDAAIALPQLATLHARCQRRVQLLQHYRQALVNQGVEAPQLPATNRPDYLTRLMVRVVPEQRKQCREALAARGIASRLPYHLPASLAGSAFPLATRSASELLELPLPAVWAAADVDQAVRCVAPFCAPARTN